MNDVVPSAEELRIQAFEAERSISDDLLDDQAWGEERTSLEALESRAEREADLDERIALWVQIDAEAERASSRESLALSGRMLRRTAVEWPGGSRKWLERVSQSEANASDKLDSLLAALDQDAVDPNVADEIATAAFGLAPLGNVELERKLIEVWSRAGKVSGLRQAMRRFVELGPELGQRGRLLLSLESAATTASERDDFVTLVVELLSELRDADLELARALSAARVRVLLSAKRIDEAASLAEDLIRRYGDDEDVSAYVDALELAPTRAWRRDRLAWLWAWRAEISDDPSTVMMQWARVQELEFADARGAARTLERALERSPVRADALVLLAESEFSRGAEATGRELVARLVRLGEDAAEQEGSAEQRARRLASFLAATEHMQAAGPEFASVEAARRRWLEQALALEGTIESLSAIERAAPLLGADAAAWDSFETQALRLGDPSSAVRAYERALESSRDSAAVRWLAERLIKLVESQLSDPRALTRGLLRVLEVEPEARWAFDRVKLSLSLERRWSDLFPLYERAIAAENDAEQKAVLLDEAAVAARDAAADPERAIGYWQQYLALRPRDGRVDQALERLYERKGDRAPLIEHLTRRLASLVGVDRLRPSERIAELELERFEGRAALGVLEELLKQGPGGPATLELLERVLSLQLPAGASVEALAEQRGAARRAARLLHREYLASSEPVRAAKALLAELALVSSDGERLTLLRELLESAESLGDVRGAFDCLGQLMVLEPRAEEHRTRLADLAIELGAVAELSELEVRAAETVQDDDLFARLVSDAARIEAGLGRPERATELHFRIFERVQSPALKLDAARALDGLLAEAGRSKERCAVLERMAELDPSAQNRGAALLESARVALEELDDAPRAAAAYRALLEASPNEPTLLDGWVRALSRTDQYEELVRALRARAAVAKEPRAAHADRAEAARLLAERLSEPDAAIEAWRALRAELGADAESFEALSALLEGQRRWPELCALIEEEAGRGGHTLLYSRLAEVHVAHTSDLGAALWAYRRAGDLDSAADLLCATASLLSDDPSIVLELAGELTQSGRLERAERVLRCQLEHYGQRRPKESATVQLGLSQVLCAAGRRDEGLSELVAAAERHPSNPGVLAALGALSFECGDLERAEQSYRALLLLVPHSAEAAAVASRAELYLALSALAERRGEAQSAEDNLAWAFEAALVSGDEAAALERGLRGSGRHALLERAIRERLERATDTRARLSALSDWVEAGVRAKNVTDDLTAAMQGLGAELERELFAGSGVDPVACARLRAAHDALGERAHSLSLLEAELERAGIEERPRLELERARRLLAIPGRTAEGVEKLWSLVREQATCDEAVKLICDLPESEERWDELLSILDQHARRAAAEARTDDEKVTRWRVATVLERAGRLDGALHGYLAFVSDETFELEALRRALSLLDELEAPATEVAKVVFRLLELVEPFEVAELAQRLTEVGESLAEPELLERGLERGFLADPSRADLRERLLSMLEERGDWPRVRDLLERTIRQKPEPELVLRLADAHLRTGAPSRALELLETVGMRVAPERAVRRRRAATLEAAGRTEEALEELVALNRAYGDASEEISSSIRRTGVWADSERWALLAIDAAIQSGNSQDLTQIVDHWVERGAHGAALLWRLAELSSQSGDHARAARVYRRLSDIEQGEQRYAALVAYAEAQVTAGDADAGLRALETALLRAPEESALFRALYQLARRVGDRERQARLLFDRAERAAPVERPALLLDAAEMLSNDGEQSFALEALAKAVALEPSEPSAVAVKARILRRMGRRDEALSLVRVAIEAEPKPRARPLARLYRELAEIYLADDELAQAFQALSRAHPLDRTDLETTWTFGVLAFDLDQKEAAAAALRAFLTLRESGGTPAEGSRVAAAYFRLACIEHDRGQLAAARRLLSLALQSDPGYTPAQRLVASIANS